MKYYVAYKEFMDMQTIVAYHEDIQVVDEFIRQNSSKRYHIGKCNGKTIKGIEGFEDMYLVRFGDTYIQAEYYPVAEDFVETAVDDYKKCIEILQRAIEFKEISHRKSVVKTIECLIELIEDEKSGKGLTQDCLKSATEMRKEWSNARTMDADDVHHYMR